MIVSDAEPHAHGWRWYLINLDTGERVATSEQTYWSETHALTVGERIMVATHDWPTTDLTENP